MVDIQLQREINALSGDLAVTKLAVNNMQIEMEELLKGEMGKDIRDVLDGKKIIKLGFFEKIKFKIRNLFRRIFKMF